MTVQRGIIHGKIIELEKEPGFPDGQVVSVAIQPVLPVGEGLKRAFGSWADDAVELDQFLEETRQARKLNHRELEG